MANTGRNSETTSFWITMPIAAAEILEQVAGDDGISVADILRLGAADYLVARALKLKAEEAQALIDRDGSATDTELIQTDPLGQLT